MREPHNHHLVLAGAHGLKELAVVRPRAHALHASDRLADGRVARSRNAIRWADLVLIHDATNT